MTNTLLFDIETTPILGYVWSPWQANLVDTVEDWHMLSVAWKWLGRGKVECQTMEGHGDDAVIAEVIRDLFDEADVVVAHNAVKFDVPKAQTRMIVHDLTPPTAFKVVDTLRVARKNFRFTHNRLDDLAEALGVARKDKHAGFSMWRGCIEGDPAAWRQMARYNRQDVRVLEQVYLALRSWDSKHPNMALIGDRPTACPTCEQTERALIIRGYRYYQVTRRVVYQCPLCHSYCYGRSLQKTDVGHVQ